MLLTETSTNEGTSHGALFVRDGGAVYRAANSQEVMAAARAVMSRRFRHGAEVLTNPRLVRVYLQTQLAMLDSEVFGVLLLDARQPLNMTSTTPSKSMRPKNFKAPPATSAITSPIMLVP